VPPFVLPPELDVPPFALPPELGMPPFTLPPLLGMPPFTLPPLLVALPVEGRAPPAEVPPLPKMGASPPPPGKPVVPPMFGASPLPSLEHAISWLEAINADKAAPHPDGQKRAITPPYRTHAYGTHPKAPACMHPHRRM
jgi:hypothetical protein